MQYQAIEITFRDQLKTLQLYKEKTSSFKVFLLTALLYALIIFIQGTILKICRIHNTYFKPKVDCH